MRTGSTLLVVVPFYTGYSTPMDRFMVYLTFLKGRKRRDGPH